jgi:Bacterial aa3 type cytochrome c oxidase subunit IV
MRVLSPAPDPFCRIASQNAFRYEAAWNFAQRARIMAHGQNSEGGHPAMDYAEHEKTYEGFVRFSVIGTIWCLTIIVGLAIGGPAQSWGTGGFLIFLSTVAMALGIFIKELNAKPVTVVFVLSLLVWAAKALH